MAEYFVDMHTHTHCSDGKLSPSQLVRKARERGLRALAITDHDTVEGLEEGRSAGGRCGVEVINGVEMSTVLGEREIHLLGYFFDPASKRLVKALGKLREGRVSRGRKIVERLNDLGIVLSFEAVEEKAQGAVVARPHVAEALVEAGQVASYQEAFQKYLKDGGPACVRKPLIPVEEALGLLHEAGGIGVMAHPGQWTNDALVRELVRSGLDGIEVYHPSHRPWLIGYYQRLARGGNLIETGGSDYHGHPSRGETNFGRYGLSRDQLMRIRQAVA